MPDDQNMRRPGRPRQYASGADRVAALRRRRDQAREMASAMAVALTRLATSEGDRARAMELAHLAAQAGQIAGLPDSAMPLVPPGPAVSAEEIAALTLHLAAERRRLVEAMAEVVDRAESRHLPRIAARIETAAALVGPRTAKADAQ